MIQSFSYKHCRVFFQEMRRKHASKVDFISHLFIDHQFGLYITHSTLMGHLILYTRLKYNRNSEMIKLVNAYKVK